MKILKVCEEINFCVVCVRIYVLFAAYVLMKRMVDTYVDKYLVIVAQEESSLTFFREYFSLSITAFTLPCIFLLSTIVEEKMKAEFCGFFLFVCFF